MSKPSRCDLPDCYVCDGPLWVLLHEDGRMTAHHGEGERGADVPPEVVAASAQAITDWLALWLLRVHEYEDGPDPELREIVVDDVRARWTP